MSDSKLPISFYILEVLGCPCVLTIAVQCSSGIPDQPHNACQVTGIKKMSRPTSTGWILLPAMYTLLLGWSWVKFGTKMEPRSKSSLVLQNPDWHPFVERKKFPYSPLLICLPAHYYLPSHMERQSVIPAWKSSAFINSTCKMHSQTQFGQHHCEVDSATSDISVVWPAHESVGHSSGEDFLAFHFNTASGS